MLEVEVVYGAIKSVSVIITSHYGGRKAQRDSRRLLSSVKVRKTDRWLSYSRADYHTAKAISPAKAP